MAHTARRWPTALGGGRKRQRVAAALYIPLGVLAAACAMAVFFYFGGVAAKIGLLCHDKSVSHGCIEGATVALTFDDGPGEHTPHLLDILLANNIKATFYILGKRISHDANGTTNAKHRETVMRMVHEGHMIASHGFSHMDLGHENATVNEVGWDIFAGINEIYKLTGGKRVRHFRPPYLSMDSFGLLHASGLQIDHVTCSTADWYWDMLAQNETLLRAAGQSAHEYVGGAMMAEVKRCLERRRSTGVILLQHDTKALSVRTTQTIIDHIKSAGYRFVRMDECTGVPEFW